MVAMKTMLVLSAFGIVAGSSLGAQLTPSVPIPLGPNDSDYYPWITQLSPSKPTWSTNPQDSVRGRRYRVAVLTSEIFNTLVIELVTYGTEGCCAKIAWSRRADMDALQRSFRISGELAGLVVTAWRSDRSFEFTLHGRRFLASIEDGPKLTVQEL